MPGLHTSTGTPPVALATLFWLKSSARWSLDKSTSFATSIDCPAAGYYRARCGSFYVGLTFFPVWVTRRAVV